MNDLNPAPHVQYRPRPHRTVVLWVDGKAGEVEPRRGGSFRKQLPVHGTLFHVQNVLVYVGDVSFA